MQCGITSLQSSVGHALALLPPAADTKILPAPFGLGTIKCRRRQKVRCSYLKEVLSFRKSKLGKISGTETPVELFGIERSRGRE